MVHGDFAASMWTFLRAWRCERQAVSLEGGCWGCLVALELKSMCSTLFGLTRCLRPQATDRRSVWPQATRHTLEAPYGYNWWRLTAGARPQSNIAASATGLYMHAGTRSHDLLAAAMAGPSQNLTARLVDRMTSELVHEVVKMTCVMYVKIGTYQ